MHRQRKKTRKIATKRNEDKGNSDRRIISIVFVWLKQKNEKLRENVGLQCGSV